MISSLSKTTIYNVDSQLEEVFQNKIPQKEYQSFNIPKSYKNSYFISFKF